jgi:steroid 5-alpha reductase family enzyme
MSLSELLAVGAAATFVYMTAIWLLSLVLRNASIVDIFWGPGFVVLAWVYLVFGEGWETRGLIITALCTIWGLRLGLHILVRNWGHGEDPRYVKFREAAGDAFWWRSYFTVFLLQGVIMYTVGMPLLAANNALGPDELRPLDFAGIVVWAIGFMFEAVGDWQLVRFKADPANRGKVMDRGLWRYTRHPNYFGDATLWWGFFLIAAASTDGWLTIISPVLMTFLLVRVSGVSLLERNMKRNKPGYIEYIESTSGFLPLPPRRGRGPTA